MWRIIGISILVLTKLCSGSNASAQTKLTNPKILSIQPGSVTAGGPSFQLSIIGAYFQQNVTQAGWLSFKVFLYRGAPYSYDGVFSELQTTLISDSILTAIVPAELIAQPGTVEIRVMALDSIFQNIGDALASNAINFQILAAGVPAPGFSPAASLNEPRAAHTATRLMNGRVLIVGGAGAPGTAELFDPVTGTFTLTGPLRTARAGFHTATLLADGRVLIAGGLGLADQDNYTALSSAEIFDPTTNTFKETAPMRQGRVKHTATLLVDGRVLIAGGASYDSGFISTASAELFDPATGAFQPAGSLISDRADHTATLFPVCEVLIAGGWKGRDAKDDLTPYPFSAELSDPSNSTFHRTADMSATRVGHSAIPLPDGKVLLIGGLAVARNIQELFQIEFSGQPFVEVYDPVKQTFSGFTGLLNNMPWRGFSTTLLNDGNILLAGGYRPPYEDLQARVLNGGVLFDSASPALYPEYLTATGSLAQARFGHTATLLNDGRVLVVGGTANGEDLTSAEIYSNALASLTLTPVGAATTSTSGTSPLVAVGYATAAVNSGAAPYGIAVFSLTQNGFIASEAAVPASSPIQSARVLVEYRTGITAGIGTIDVYTGLAIARRSNSTASLTYTLRDGNGQIIATGHSSLPPHAHRAKILHDLLELALDFNLPHNLSTAIQYCSLVISSSQPISVLGLRLTVNQRAEALLTSTLLADLSRPLTSSTFFFPLLADGDGYTTTLILSNTSGATETGTISISDGTGAPLSVRRVDGTVGPTF